MIKHVLLLLTFLAVVAPAAAAQGQGRMRFPEMDRNNDGVITRDEWRGTDRSFRNHDWNGDGVLSGDEVRPGGRRAVGTRGRNATLQELIDEMEWTEERFVNLDHNRDGRISPREWHADPEIFRRIDRNNDGFVSRREFLGFDDEDQDREDRFAELDANGDGRITRSEWHGSLAVFDRLDDNRDGVLTRQEALGRRPDPRDMFASIDVNGDRVITRAEWHWSMDGFDRLDANRDGRITRAEFETAPGEDTPPQSAAYRAGYDRGLHEGQAAGREDRDRHQGWDLEGQRELERADSGYDARFGPLSEYQAGYRAGFRLGYREGFGPR